jgi:transaldolase
MRPAELKTRIFLDSGSAEETRDIIEKLGFLDGQTTNPTYFVTKNPDIRQAVEAGKKFSREALLEEYQKLAKEVSPLVGERGSVSIEVYADKNTTVEEMVGQAHEMYGWIDNAHIKLPVVRAGLAAAEQLVAEGLRINMTLCFSEAQAAAVHAATRGAAPGQVFVSPFISRFDKIGQNGFDLLLNIQKMFREAESHVSILAASVHSVYDIAHVIETEMDIITIPYEDLLGWIAAGKPVETSRLHQKDTSALASIPREDFDLSQTWSTFDIRHELTDQGLQHFADDWNSVLQ